MAGCSVGAGIRSQEVILLFLGLFVALILGKLWRKEDKQNEHKSEDLRLSLRLAGWLLFFGSLVYALGQLSHGAVQWLLVPLGLLLLLQRPMFLVQEVFLPRGWVKWTYRGALLSLWLTPDRRGQALLYGNLALLRAPLHHDPRADEEYLTAHQKQLPGGAASLVAAAMLLARREGLAAAGPILRCLDTVDDTVKPDWAMAVACELQLVELIRIGDWRKVRKLSAECKKTPLIEFLAACAQVFVPMPEESPPSRDSLYWLWLRAPQKQHLWRLLEQAQDHKPAVTESTPNQSPQMADQPRLAAALRALGQLWRREAHLVRPEQLRRVGELWDHALADKETERMVMTRALTLTIPGSEHKALQTLRTQVVATLHSYLRQGAMPTSKLFPDGQIPNRSVLGEAVLAVRAELLEQFEAATTKLEERTTDKRVLPWLDEWREWAQIRDSYQRLEEFGGAEARRLGWTALHRQANNWACWLWNARGEKVLANAVFRFLLRESEALGDDRTGQLAKKNVGSGL